MKRLVLLGVLLVAAVALPAHAQVRVGIDIGIRLPGPPAFVPVPGAPVYYAPRAPANVFLYGQQYWAFTNGGWYVGPTWNGPWAVVQPVLGNPTPLFEYEPGTWGPAEADALTAPAGGWHTPAL